MSLRVCKSLARTETAGCPLRGRPREHQRLLHSSLRAAAMINALTSPRLQRVVSLIDGAAEALVHPLLKAGFRVHIFEFDS